MDKFIVVKRYQQRIAKDSAVRVPGAQFVRLRELSKRADMSKMALIAEMIDFCAERFEVMTEVVNDTGTN